MSLSDINIYLENQPQPLHQQILDLLAEGHLAQVLEIYPEIRAIAPEFTTEKLNIFYEKLGDLWQGKEDLAATLVSYERAKELGPPSISLLTKLADLYKLMGQQSQIQVNQIYLKAMEADPTNEKYYYQYLATQPYNHQIYAQLADCLVKKGRWSEAIVFYQMGLLSDLDNAYIHQQLGKILAAQHQYNLAIAEYEIALASDNQNPQLYDQLGLLLLSMGKIERAIASLEKAINLAPDDPLLINHLGEALIRNGQINEAIAQYEKAIALDEQSWLGYKNLGDAYVKLGDQEKAKTYYMQVLSTNYQHPSSL
jgi:tetratricopeptide (TPR) repeat protein